MATFSESRNRMLQAAKLLPNLRLDRCTHKNAGGTALWVYNDKGDHIGSMTLFDGQTRWKANRMYRSMPTSEHCYDTLAEACKHISGEG